MRKVAKALLSPRSKARERAETALAVFDVGIAKLHLNQKHCADLVTSEHTNPAGWQARNRAVTAMQYGISPRASNFREWCKPERKAKNARIF